MFCALVSLSVSAYSIAEASVREELDTSTELSLLGITTFTITFGAAPLLIAPLSEVYGRSYIYLASSLIFAIFFIPQALATNIETILITRFISGIAGSSAVSLVGGTLSDVWSARDRGFCMSIFSFAAFGCESIFLVRRHRLIDTDKFSVFQLPDWVQSCSDTSLKRKGFAPSTGSCSPSRAHSRSRSFPSSMKLVARSSCHARQPNYGKRLETIAMSRRRSTREVL